MGPDVIGVPADDIPRLKPPIAEIIPVAFKFVLMPTAPLSVSFGLTPLPAYNFKDPASSTILVLVLLSVFLLIVSTYASLEIFTSPATSSADCAFIVPIPILPVTSSTVWSSV
jgi:hypothetical protein